MKDGAEFCRNTTKQIIRAAGFTSAKPRYAQLVREPNKLKRVDFCRTLIDENDTLDDIIFTDESSIQLHHNKQTTYRLTDAPNPSLPKPKHPLKVHVWGGISRRGQTMCIIFDGIWKKNSSRMPYWRRPCYHSSSTDFQTDIGYSRTMILIIGPNLPGNTWKAQESSTGKSGRLVIFIFFFVINNIM